ncbi:RNA polymerase subunit [Carp edema virus]|nr:RNA polymerase subunit [Carp edema virus]
MAEGLSKEELQVFFDEVLEQNPDIVLDEKQRKEVFEWCYITSQKNDVMEFNVNKANLENLEFSTQIFSGLNFILDSKNKKAYTVNPVCMPDATPDSLEKFLFAFEKPQKIFLQYMHFCIKCIKKGIEYDNDKIVEVDDYDKYFNIKDKIVVAYCPECNSGNVFPRIAQTRSIDEAATVKFICQDCRKVFNPPSFKKTLKIQKN